MIHHRLIPFRPSHAPRHQSRALNIVHYAHCSLFLRLLGVLCVFSGLLPPLVRAEQFGAFTYTSNGAAITITGYTGAGGAVTIPATINGLPVRTIGNQAFYNETGLISVALPPDIFSLGSSAFERCTNLISVAIPSKLTSIGDRVFRDCPALSNIVFSNSLISIGESAFAGCAGLASLILPNSLISIGESAFYYCTSLTYVNIPSSITSFGKTAFAGCSKLTSVTFADGLRSIGEGAFGSCTSLGSVVIPDSVKIIGINAFYRCENLENVIIGSRMNTIANSDGTSIGERAFMQCWNLRTLFIGNNVSIIGNSSFYECENLSVVIFGNKLTSIGADAFSRCNYLRSISIPDSVISIGDSAFLRCTELLRVTIGNGVTSIGSFAFLGCTSLTRVIIGKSVTSIGERAFQECYKLTTVIFEGNAPSSYYNRSDYRSVFYLPDSEFKIYFYNDNYGFTSPTWDGWPSVALTRSGDFGYTIENGNITITGYTGPGGAVPIPGSIAGRLVRKIASAAFTNKSNLIIVTIPSSVTGIDYGAFADCGNLLNIHVAADNTIYRSIDGVLFDKAGTSLVQCPAGRQGHYAIPGNVTFIYGVAFIGCSRLTSVAIPDSVGGIGTNAFECCTGLTHIRLPRNLTSISNSSFYGCTRLESISIPSSVSYVGNQAFRGCTSLRRVSFPQGLTTIGDQAFSRCASLLNATFAGNAPASFGTKVFEEVASNFRVYFYKDRAGFTAPNWQGYPVVQLNATAPPSLETWRRQHFGAGAINSGSAADSADPDGDGSTNVEEFNADTDPKNARSVLQITSTTKVDARTYKLTFNAQPVRFYEIERLMTFPGATWQPVAHLVPQPAAAQAITYTDTAAPSDAVFYRVRASLP